VTRGAPTFVEDSCFWQIGFSHGCRHQFLTQRFDLVGELLDFRPNRTIEDGITEVLQALRAGAVDPDDRKWYTLRQYQFLADVERTFNDVAMDGRVLS